MPDNKILNYSVQGSTTGGEKDLITRVMGRFYTHELVGHQLVSAILHAVRWENHPVLRIIDPFCGDGRLVCWLLEEMVSTRVWGGQTLDVELWDCDEAVLRHAAASVTQVGVKLNLPLNVHVRAGDTFERALKHWSQFNIVIANPPWEVLKPDSRELKRLTKAEAQAYTNWLKAKDELLTRIYPLSQPKRKFSGWGTNLARCGTEVALRLLAPQGVCGLVSPASLLADQMTEKLRHWVFREHIIHELAYYPAEARLFSKVDQCSITLVASAGRSEKFSPLLSVYNRERQAQTRSTLSISWDEMEANGLTLPIHFGGEQMELFKRWRTLPTFGELEGSESFALWAGRELDETGHKRFLGLEGDYLFLKGRMIKRFGIVEEPSQFITFDGSQIPSSADYHRIAWRDVSRPSQKRRLHATLIPPKWVTGNSLHVAYFRDHDLMRLKALLAVMNSLVFEFHLRAYLATSHVSLSSVRKVRIPSLTDCQLVARLAQLVDQCLAGCETSQVEIEIQVAQAYGLERHDFKLLLSAFNKLTDVEINALVPHKTNLPNHYSPRLSDLDLMMVRAVPPGGNWKDIPESVPSKRLEQIRQSYAAGKGSRSTYYGRLKPDAPSYTISTYFNRPGNGCHIHYDYEGGQHRLISQREAARLQSFPDSFVFYGSRQSVNDQIGNAVPPLLAYQVAMQLGEPGYFVDLFSGAGGLSLGFVWAGWTPLVANDINETFLATYRANVHKKVIPGDLRQPEVFGQVITSVREVLAQLPPLRLIVLGGPPCQGFSTAGNRRSMSDERNRLFEVYKEILGILQPDVFLFENVTGLLNMEGGAVFRMIKQELSAYGHKIDDWKLHAEEYGVPQRRTRVFIVGCHAGSSLFTSPPLITSFRATEPLLPHSNKAAVSVKDALDDLPPLQPGEDGSDRAYRFPPSNPYQSFMRGLTTVCDLVHVLAGGSTDD